MVRGARKEDFDSVKRLWTLCFDDDEVFVEWNFKNNYSEENTFVAECEGKVVSALQSIPFELAIKNEIVSADGVWGVSTHPNLRGKGYARKLFEYSLPRVRTRGGEVSVLVSAVGGMYEKFGYVKVCDNTSYAFDKIKCTPVGTVDDEVISELEDVYASAMENNDIYVKRSREYWKKSLIAITEVSGGRLFRTENGYITALPNGDGFCTSEVCGSKENMREYKTMPVMARVTNVSAVVKKLAAYFEDGSKFVVKDDIIAENNCAYEIRNGVAVKFDASDDISDNAMDISEFTRIVFAIDSDVRKIYMCFPLEI